MNPPQPPIPSPAAPAAAAPPVASPVSQPPATPHTSFDPTHDEEMLQPVAFALAFLIPGLGHAYLGQARRGVMIGIGVLGLFISGLFIGGVDSVDRREDFFWFLGQALVGPVAFGVDYYHQNHLKVTDPGSNVPRSPRPNEKRLPDGTAAPLDASKGERPPYSKSLGRANELGTLYTTVAGMMNLICMIDAAFNRRKARPA
ncbi:MAG: hypothetical protein JNM07_04265 [Phycisphaerae bacterium]|nr:hypothetical protein [Phycisphaerae bacterium]